MARTGLKKAKTSSSNGSQGSKAGGGKKAQSSNASNRPKSKGPDNTHQLRQEQRRHATRNVSANSKVKAKSDGTRDDIDETFKKMRSENGGDGSALRVRQEVSAIAKGMRHPRSGLNPQRSTNCTEPD